MKKLQCSFSFYLKSLKWKELSFFQHFIILGIIYRSFWGYNTFKPFSIIRSLLFYFKKRKVVVLINVRPSNKEIKEKIENIVTEVDKILISISSSDWGEEGMNQIIAFDNLKDLIAKYPNKITFYKGAWQTKHAQLQYSLDFIKKNFIEVTHCILIDDDSFPNSHVIKKSINYIQKFKYYNRRIDFSFQNNGVSNNKESITLFPVRKHIVFKNENEISAGTLKINFNSVTLVYNFRLIA